MSSPTPLPISVSHSKNMWIPSSFFCPLSKQLMTDPLITTDGHTYQRTSIQKRFSDGILTSPVTGRVLETRTLLPNHAICIAIQEWEERVITRLARHALPLKPIRSDDCQCQKQFSSNLDLSGAPCETQVLVQKVSSSRVHLSAMHLVRMGRHPHLARMKGICEDGGETLLATERAPHGTLLDAISKLHRRNPGTVTWHHRVSMLQQICSALNFLEEAGHPHDCIREKNIQLFDFCETDPGHTSVKLSGYGFTPCQHELSTYEDWSRIESHEGDVSPGELWNESARVWMFGVLAMKILSLGEFEIVRTDDAEREENLSERKKRRLPAYLRYRHEFDRPRGCPVLLWLKVKRCLRQRCSDRPGFSHLSKFLFQIFVDDEASSADSEVLVINIQSLSGSDFSIRTRRDSSIYEVKENIQSVQGIRTDPQRLCFQGRVLEEDCTVGHYNIRDGSVLHLFLAMRRWMSPST